MGTQAQPAVEKRAACIARQPILTADETVVGYELLFRETQQHNYFASDAEVATCTVIDTLSVMGLGVVCDDRLAFINCTRPLLKKEFFTLLDPAKVVLEIQETVADDETVGEACQELKQAGFKIALDNFVPGDARQGLVSYADFIKIDIRKVPWEESARLVPFFASKGCKMLAQRVETREQFVTAKKNKFTQFQGYFFRRPERLKARQMLANQATCLQLLRAASKPEPDFRQIEDLIKQEPALCYRLLRYLNSPLLGLPSSVLSVRHALKLLGEKESIKWIRMATTVAMAQGKSSDLILSSLVRARFCELISPKVAHGESDLFLMGLLSLMDAILEVPIGVLVEELSLDPDIKEQLLSAKTGRKTPLSPAYDLMTARESGDWENVANLGKQLNLSLYFMAVTYNEAMVWAHQVTGAASPVETPRDPNGASLS